MIDRKINDAIQLISGTRFRDDVFIIPCNVDAVNIAKRTIDVTPITGKSDTPILGVRLMAEVDDGLLMQPVINSTVFIAYSRTTSAFVVQFSAIDHVWLYVGGSSLEVKNDGTFLFNGGTNGGLVNIASLVTKLNNLETLVNNIVSQHNLHTHATNGAVTLQTVSGSLTNTQRADIEDTKVTH